MFLSEFQYNTYKFKRRLLFIAKKPSFDRTFDGINRSLYFKA